MLSKTQLFHLKALTPLTPKEASDLITLIESTTTYILKKSILNEAYTISNIYCNRENIFSTVEFFPPLPPEKEPEYYQLSIAIEQFINSFIDSYYLLSVKKPNACLNVEVCLINKQTVIISYELY